MLDIYKWYINARSQSKLLVTGFYSFKDSTTCSSYRSSIDILNIVPSVYSQLLPTPNPLHKNN